MNNRAPFANDQALATITEGLIACTWPAKDWTHDCHWAAAFWLIGTRGLSRTQSEMPQLIRRYNEAVGGKNTDSEGYHETITHASILAAAHALNSRDNAPIYLQCNALVAGSMGTASWIETYWSRDVLFSVKARREWVAPDRAPLPFNISAYSAPQRRAPTGLSASSGADSVS